MELLEKLILAHNAVGQIFTQMNKADNVNKEIDKLKKDMKSNKEVVLIISVVLFVMVCGPIWLVLNAIDGLLGRISFWLMVAVCVYIVYLITRKIEKSTNAKIQEAIERYNVEDSKLDEIIGKNLDKMSFLPEDYRYPMATSYLVKVVKDKRANTLNEALNMYDMQLHRWKVENVNAQILAQKEAQTAYLKNINNNTKISAVADVATAITFMSK